MKTKEEDDTLESNGKPWLLEPYNYLNGYLTLTHSTAVAIGIPLNLAIVATIIGTRRLRNARNFSWLGIGFSSVFLLVSHVFESLAVHWQSPETIALCSWFTGHPYQTILFNLFLTLIERYLCLKRSRWHKRWVARNCWIIPVVQVGSSVLVFGLTHAYQLFPELIHFDWPLSLSGMKVMSSFLLATFFISLTGIAALWSTCNRAYPAAQTMTSNRQMTANSSSHTTRSDCPEEGQLAPSEDEKANDKGPFVLIEGERVSQLDVDAARVLTLSGFIILSSYFPMLVGLTHLFLCLDGLSDRLKSSNDGTECDNMAQIMYYQRELISIPCFLVLPVYLVISSRDLKSVLRDRRRLMSLQMATFSSSSPATPASTSSDEAEIDISS